MNNGFNNGRKREQIKKAIKIRNVIKELNK